MRTKILYISIYLLVFCDRFDSFDPDKWGPVDWTVVGSNRYNIKDAFPWKNKNAGVVIQHAVEVPHDESVEYCEFFGKNSRLYEPRDATTRAEVMTAIYAEFGGHSGYGGGLSSNQYFWLNVVREATGGFKYASDGSEVEDDLPWIIDQPTPWGEGYVVSNLKNTNPVIGGKMGAIGQGEWITTKSTRKANVLCQTPVKWVRIENLLYVIGSSKKRDFLESKKFCHSLGDGATLFEPRTTETTLKVISELGLTGKDKLWTATKTIRSLGDGQNLTDNVEVPALNRLGYTGLSIPDSIPRCGVVCGDPMLLDAGCEEEHYALCQKPVVPVNPDCNEDCSGDCHGKHNQFVDGDQTAMNEALTYFCALPTREKKQEFIDCPQVTGDAENFFLLAKEVGCGSDDFSQYTFGCDFVCQRIKAQAFANFDSSKDASESFFIQEENKYEKKKNYYQKLEAFFKGLSKTFASYAASIDPEAMKISLYSEIENSDLVEKEKNALREKISGADGTTNYKEVESYLKTKIVQQASAANIATEEKEAANDKRKKVADIFKKSRKSMKTMKAVDTLSKGSEAAGHLASAVQKFIKSDGNVKQILSGCFDLVSALSVFLPPPYSQITGAISSIANMFLGGGSTDTATIIQTEFARQSKLILDQFENLKTFIVDELKAQTLDQMYLLAEGVLADLSIKMVFVDSFRDQDMTKDLAREIKNEIHAFQNNAEIASFRLTFDEYCTDIFEKYHVYNVNTQTKEIDKRCLYLAYAYLMIQVTGRSVLTSMINKLIASDAEDNKTEELSDTNRLTSLWQSDTANSLEANSEKNYLSHIADGFLNVQEFLLETDKRWLGKIFRKRGNLICGAFNFDVSMWNDESEKGYCLMYIGAIDPEMKAYIENYKCYEENAAKIDDGNVKTLGSQLLRQKGVITKLDNWGRTFIVDFFLHYSVCPGMPKCTKCSYDAFANGRCYYNGKKFSWSHKDKNIFQITNGKKKKHGYHFPTVNLDTSSYMSFYMPKSNDWDYKKKAPQLGIYGGREWYHITISQLQEGDNVNNIKMSIRLDGFEVLPKEANNILDSSDNLTVYGSSPYWESIGTANEIDQHMIHNLRLIKHVHQYTIGVGNGFFKFQIGPVTFKDAKKYCEDHNYDLYKPSFETIHKMIYRKLSYFGVTTFWTAAKKEDNKNNMLWIDGDTTTKIPGWIYSHWEHTSKMKEWTTLIDWKGKWNQNRQCTTVGFLNRGSQITAADCTKEVADVVCQPKKKHP